MFLGSDARERKHESDKATSLKARTLVCDTFLSLGLLSIGTAFAIIAETAGEGVSGDAKNVYLYIGIVSLVLGVLYLVYCMFKCREFQKQVDG